MSEAKPHSAIHASNFVPDNGGSAPEGAPNGKDKKKVRSLKTPNSFHIGVYLYSFLDGMRWNVEGFAARAISLQLYEHRIMFDT